MVCLVGSQILLNQLESSKEGSRKEIMLSGGTGAKTGYVLDKYNTITKELMRNNNKKL